MRAWARRVAHGGLAAVAAVALLLAALAVPASATDRYALVHGCYVLRAPNGAYVVKDALGYRAAAATPAAATPVRMQATALGRYLLYGPDATMPAAAPLGAVASTTAPGPAADWTLTATGGGFTLTSISTGLGLGVGLGARLAQVPVASATVFGFVPRRAARRSRRSRSTRPARRSRARAPARRCAASSTTTSTSAPSTSSAAASTAGGRGARTASRWPCGTAPTTSRTAPAPPSRTSSPRAARSAPTAPTAGPRSPAGRAQSR